MILLLGYFGYLNHKARQHQQQEIEQYIKQGCTVTPQGIDYLVECKQQTLLLDESLQNLIGISKGNESWNIGFIMKVSGIKYTVIIRNT